MRSKSKSVFVGGIPYVMDEHRLQEVFARCGEIMSVKVIRDRETGRSRGFGFVEFDAFDSVEKAIAELNAEIVDGRRLTVSRAERDKQSHSSYDGPGYPRVEK